MGSLKLYKPGGLQLSNTGKEPQEGQKYELVVPDRQSFLDFASRVGKALEHKDVGYNHPRVISGLADFLYLVVSIYAQKFNASVDRPSENL